MYSDGQNTDDGYRRTYRNPQNGMATAALVLGILSIFSGVVFFVAVPLGALSILCAILSRTEKRFSFRSGAGMVLSFIAILYSSFTTVQTARRLINDPETLAWYRQYLEEVFDEYGMSDTFDAWFGSNDVKEPSTDSPDKVAPFSDQEKDHSPFSSEDDMDPLYRDLFRYFYGGEPQPVTPAEPVPGGEFV